MSAFTLMVVIMVVVAVFIVRPLFTAILRFLNRK